MRKKVLITGANGFIGRHLLATLTSPNYSDLFEVCALSRQPVQMDGVTSHPVDFQNEENLRELLAKISPDLVVHLASLTKPDRAMAKPEMDAHVENTILPALALARCVPVSTEFSLFFGSCEEYGNAPTPFVESQRPIAFSPYGWAKISAFHGVTMIANERKIPFCWARPFLTFGPGQKPTTLIPYVIQNCLADRAIPLTLGEQTRDFLYVDDLCEMILRVLKNPRPAIGEALNLCSGRGVEIREVAGLVQKIIGRGELQFGKLPYRSNEAMSFYGSNQKFKSLYGDVKLVPMETALRATIDSYKG